MERSEASKPPRSTIAGEWELDQLPPRQSSRPSEVASAGAPAANAQAGDPAEDASAGGGGEANTPNRESLSGARLLSVLVAVTTAMILTMLDSAIITTAIPRITDEFQSLKDVGWYAVLYQLSNAALQPLTARMYAKLNSKGTFLAFLTIFEIGSFLCGAAPNSLSFILGRAVAGMGSSGLLNGAVTIATSCLRPERRTATTGLMMAISQLGIALGPVLGGVFTSFLSWRWCFYVNVPLGLPVFLLLSFIPIPEAETEAGAAKPSSAVVLRNLHRELDLVGFALFLPAAMMLLLAMQFGGTFHAWDSPTIIGLLCGSAAAFALFLAWNRRLGDDAALIPLGLMRKSIMWPASLTQLCCMTIVLSAAYFLPIYFQAVGGATPAMSGVYALASILSQVVAAGAAAALVTKTGYVVPYAVFAGVLSAVSNGLYSTLSPSSSTAQLVLYQILNGIGRGVGMQIPLLSIQSVFELKEMPMALGLLIFFGMFGASVLVGIATSIFNNTLHAELARHLPPLRTVEIIQAGATGFRRIVTAEEELRHVLEAYTVSLSKAYYLVVAVSVASVVVPLFMGRTDVRRGNRA